MKHYILVRIKTHNKSQTLLKLNKINVSLKDIAYENKYLVFKILESDIKRVKKYLISDKLEIIDETGIYKLKKELRKNLLIIVSIIFSVIIFLLLTNVIVKVNIIHSSSEIRALLSDALKEYGVEKLTLKKSYEEYEHIIENIKTEYKDKIEWLEIDVDGMVINVRVEERIENIENKEYSACHVVASKSGIIKSILTEKGIAEVKINDHVNKGDILISGMIKLNEEVKNNVCAKGSVNAEVWYNVTASLPLKYQEKTPTGKMRLNFMLKTETKEYVILKSRVENKETKSIRLFKLWNWEFYIQKEYEIETTEKVYNETEGIKELIKKVQDKLLISDSQIESIIDEKVLKKSIKNGNLYIDMFVAVKEQIGVVEHYDVEMDSGNDDQEHSGDNNQIN